MIYQQLQSSLHHSANVVCLIDGEQTWTTANLFDRVENLAQRLTGCQDRRCGIATGGAASLLIAIGAIEAAGGVPVLLPTSTDQLGRNGNDQQFPLATTLCDECVRGNGAIDVELVDTENSTTKSDSLILFTSGTSGQPKPVTHSWASLRAAIKLGESYRNRRWWLAYEPRSFAGLQVLIQSVLTGGTLVTKTRTPQGDAEQLVRHEVEFASATPTYWRSLLNSASPETLGRWRPRQITLGGEIADQLLLDRLRETFPAARITHIYASTELGVCFSVHDGRAGFPTQWLNSNLAARRLRMTDDELQIKQPLDEKWFATGDLIEVTDERVQFAGRISDTIHIGGQKALPAQIENVIRQVPEVIEVRVFGVASSLTGQIAAAEIQLPCEADESLVRDQILTACRQRLPKFMMPATLTFSTQPLTTGDKLKRQR